MERVSNGKKKRAKDGASLGYDGNDLIYAFKGGSTQEFWRYSISNDSWIQSSDLPLDPSHKKVKSGGALAFAHGRIYGFKGNNTREFWLYTPGPSLFQKNYSATYPVLQNNGQSFAIPHITISPNPSRSLLRIQYTPVEQGLVQIKIFDVAGKLRYRTNINNNNGIIDLPTKALSSGIYFLRLETERLNFEQKFIIKK